VYKCIQLWRYQEGCINGADLPHQFCLTRLPHFLDFTHFSSAQILQFSSFEESK